MFRKSGPSLAMMRGFPRVRGDVPQGFRIVQKLYGFSPRARGCSYLPSPITSPARVFPACAGMFLHAPNSFPMITGFPRVRGDVPPHSAPQRRRMWVFPACAGMFRNPFDGGLEKQGFPRVRGDVPPCLVQRLQRFRVFPACAGMFLINTHALKGIASFPRVRGDVPMTSACLMKIDEFSPRARGCS